MKESYAVKAIVGLMSFRDGDLVAIHDLKSEQGKMLNGSLGKIVDCSNPPRFGVKILQHAVHDKRGGASAAVD